MAKHHPENERVKREYFDYLKEARRQSEASVDAAADSISRFESYTRHRDFRRFHVQQAKAFKQHLANQDSRATGRKLSKATQYAALAHLKRFFQWLSGHPGYRSKLKSSDAEYFNLSDKDARVATARRARPAPTLDEVKRVIASMPGGTEVELRDRALLAFTLATGARDSALASLKLGHVNLGEGWVFQDAREVKTKNSKSIRTMFFPVGADVLRIVEDWIAYLRTMKLWGDDDPIFPATRTTLGVTAQFEANGLDRRHWASASPVREIFKRAFCGAGLPYFNPHSLRSTLVQLGQARCRTAEEFKAWSQNLGHEGVLTTFISYGRISDERQGELIRSLTEVRTQNRGGVDDVEAAMERVMRRAGLLTTQ